MNTNAYSEPVLRRNSPLPDRVTCWSSERADAAIEFGRFRVLLRRQLLAGGVPVGLGARSFDLLVALLEADEALVTKQELMSRVWPGLVVSKENIKVQVSSLRKALGADRDVILTDFGRGYRFTGVLTSNAAAEVSQRHLRSKPRPGRSLFAWDRRRSLRRSSARTRTIKDT